MSRLAVGGRCWEVRGLAGMWYGEGRPMVNCCRLVREAVAGPQQHSPVSPWCCGLSALPSAGAASDVCLACHPRPCSCSCVICCLWPALACGSVSSHQPQPRWFTVPATDPRLLRWSCAVSNRT